MFRTGLDRLLADPEALRGRRYGLLAHAASVTAELEPIHLALARRAPAPPALLLAPEHGFHGVEQDMVPAAESRDPWTGIPIASLYGDSEASLAPAPELFGGHRPAAGRPAGRRARATTPTPRPPSGRRGRQSRPGVRCGCSTGPTRSAARWWRATCVKPGYESFVGAFALPVRHGLTLAELVLLEARRGGWSDGIAAWRLEGWRRSMLWPDLGRPWVAPSPNMPRFETALVYPGGCLDRGHRRCPKGAARPGRSSSSALPGSTRRGSPSGWRRRRSRVSGTRRSASGRRRRSTPARSVAASRCTSPRRLPFPPTGPASS